MSIISKRKKYAVCRTLRAFVPKNHYCRELCSTAHGGRTELKMSDKKISKAKSIKRAKRLTELVISLAIVASGVYLVKGAVDRSTTVAPSQYFDNTDISDDPIDDTEVDPNQTIYENTVVATKDKFKGDLILVNENYQYFSTGEEALVSVLEKNEELGKTTFGAYDYSTQVLASVYDPMAQMIDDFYNATSLDDIIIYGGFRTHDVQQQLYDDDLAANGTEESTRVAKPGFSEHESGYAFDLSKLPDYDYEGTGEYAWFTQNCYKYGFILRYPEGKESITAIQYEPWHFRYVGLPHAYYIMQNGLCLEEYIDLVRQHPYGSDPLTFTDENGKNYEVYFVASDDGNETTSIPVPAGIKYEISGNNADGFIVTVYKDEPVTAEPATEAPTEAETETVPEDTAQDVPAEQ